MDLASPAVSGTSVYANGLIIFYKFIDFLLGFGGFVTVTCTVTCHIVMCTVMCHIVMCSVSVILLCALSRVILLCALSRVILLCALSHVILLCALSRVILLFSGKASVLCCQYLETVYTLAV